MNDDLFGMETMPDSPSPKESEEAPPSFEGVPEGEAAGWSTVTDGGAFGQGPPGLLDAHEGVAGVDFPQMAPPAAPTGPPPVSPNTFGQTPGAGTEASRFPEIAAPAGSAGRSSADRSGPRNISIGGGGLGALGAGTTQQVRPAALLVPTCIGVPGLAAAVYLWLIVGTWPLAAVASSLSVVGALFCWVLLKD